MNEALWNFCKIFTGHLYVFRKLSQRLLFDGPKKFLVVFLYVHPSYSPQKCGAMTSPTLRIEILPKSNSPSPKTRSQHQLARIRLAFVSIMSDMPILSQSAKELLTKVRMIVPPMLEKFHKGKKTTPEIYTDPRFDIYFQDNWAGWLSSVAVKSAWHKPGGYLLTPPSIRGITTHTRHGLSLSPNNSYTGAPYFSAMASARLGSSSTPVDFRTELILWTSQVLTWYFVPLEQITLPQKALRTSISPPRSFTVPCSLYSSRLRRHKDLFP